MQLFKFLFIYLYCSKLNKQYFKRSDASAFKGVQLHVIKQLIGVQLHAIKQLIGLLTQSI
jgi:hypothetical protein